MAINLELYLPPSYTTTVQLYARVGGAAVGSPVAGVPDGGNPTLYVFNLGTPAIGDYDVQLSGVSTPNGPKFPMRVTSTTQYYLAEYWYLIDAIVLPGGLITPPTTPNTCRVRIHASRGATGQQSRVVITTSSVGRENELAFLNLSIDAETDVTGLINVDLPWSASPGVGLYRFRIIDLVTGKTLHDRTCTVPSVANADYEDLV